jgi:hypothetical protein
MVDLDGFGARSSILRYASIVAMGNPLSMGTSSYFIHKSD